jgi:hypothetical protein
MKEKALLDIPGDEAKNLKNGRESAVLITVSNVNNVD